MTAYAATRVKTATLVANVVDSFEIEGNHSQLELVHHGNVSTPVYFKVAGAVTAPTVAGDNCEVVLSGERIALTRAGNSASSFVSVISAGAVTVTVVGVR